MRCDGGAISLTAKRREGKIRTPLTHLRVTSSSGAKEREEDDEERLGKSSFSSPPARIRLCRQSTIGELMSGRGGGGGGRGGEE